MHENGASASAGLPDGFRRIHERSQNGRHTITPQLKWTKIMYLILRYNRSGFSEKVVHEKPADEIVLVTEPVCKVTCTV
jgi:hypothetical protein